MIKKAFPKEELQKMTWGDYSDGYRIVEDTISGTGRWSVYHDMVFEYESKFYRTSYSVAATESQCEEPYEYENDMVDCTEVEPIQKTITVYEDMK